MGVGEQRWLNEYWQEIAAELGLGDDCELHVDVLRSKARGGRGWRSREASASPGQGSDSSRCRVCAP